MTTSQDIAQHALGQDEPAQVQGGEIALPQDAILGPDRKAVLDVERQPHVDRIGACVDQSGNRHLRQHRVDIVDLIADLEADLAVDRAEDKAHEIALGAVAEHHAGHLAGGDNARLLEDPVLRFDGGDDPVGIFGGPDAGVQGVAGAVLGPDHGAGHHLLDLKDRCIAAGQDVSADVVETVEQLVAGEVLGNRLRVTIWRHAIERGTEQASGGDGVGEVRVLRVEVDQDLLAGGEREAVGRAEFEGVVDVVDAIEIAVCRVDDLGSGQWHGAIVGLQDLDERLRGAVARDPDRPLERLGQPALDVVIANRGETERRRPGLEGRPVGRNREAARGRARHRAVGVAAHDDQVAAVELGRDDRARHLDVAFVENGGGVLGQAVDRSVPGVERTIGLAGFLVVTLDRSAVGDDLGDVGWQAGLTEQRATGRSGAPGDHGRARAIGELVDVVEHARRDRDHLLGQITRVDPVDAVLRIGGLYFREPGKNRLDIGHVEIVVRIAVLVRDQKIGVVRPRRGREQQPRQRTVGTGRIRMAAIDVGHPVMHEGLRPALTGRQLPPVEVVGPCRFMEIVLVGRVPVHEVDGVGGVAFAVVEVRGDVAECLEEICRAAVVTCLADRPAAPAVVGTVIVGPDSSIFADFDVIGVAVAGRVNRDRAICEQLGAVEAIVAAEGIVEIGIACTRGVIERGQVIDVLAPVGVGLHGHAAEHREVDLEQGARERLLLLAGEIVRRRAGVGVAAGGDDHPLGDQLAGDRVDLLDHLHPVRRVVLLRPRQAAHDVDGVPCIGTGLHHLGDDAGVGVEVDIPAAAAGADAAVRRRDVDRDGRFAVDQDRIAVGVELLGDVDSCDLAVHAATRRPVVVVVLDRTLDQAERQGFGHVELGCVVRIERVLVAECNRKDPHIAIRLGDVEPPVGAPYQCGRLGDRDLAVEIERARGKVVGNGHFSPPNRQQRTECRFRTRERPLNFFIVTSP